MEKKIYILDEVSYAKIDNTVGANAHIPFAFVHLSKCLLRDYIRKHNTLTAMYTLYAALYIIVNIREY